MAAASFGTGVLCPIPGAGPGVGGHCLAGTLGVEEMKNILRKRVKKYRSAKHLSELSSHLEFGKLLSAFSPILPYFPDIIMNHQFRDGISVFLIHL